MSFLDTGLQPLEKDTTPPKNDLDYVHLYYRAGNVLYLDRGLQLVAFLLVEGFLMLCKPWTWKSWW